jgi:multicomponent K+:H+ antiporter subunit D
VAFLVALCIVLGTAASPIMQYLEHAATSLHEPQDYIRNVLAETDAGSRRAEP